MLSAYLKVGYFSDEFVRYGLANFWMFAMLLAVLGMTLAILSAQQRSATQLMALSAKVFSVSGDGIMITDAGNKLVAVNPAFTELTGYASEEVLGRNPSLLSSGHQIRQFYVEMWEKLIEDGLWAGEIWHRRKNGEAYLAKLTINAVKDQAGRVINWVGIFSDITASRAEQESVVHQAQHDFLTNLPNRLLFRDRFMQQLAIARRRDIKFAVIYIDLDRFKPVNDNFGHQVGDQLLVAVAERLSSMVREIDTVSRFGGDEFAVLVSEVSGKEEVSILAEKILRALEMPFLVAEHALSVSASLGVAMYPDNGCEMNEIMDNADAAMYLAKRSGKITYS
jgi:diguanylate cyclase (GGDEF)-like protein/PAS domain S-box-containing protein